MSLERKRRILQVLDQALAEEAQQRAGVVAQLCADDEALREEVMSRLEAQPGGLLGSPVFDVHGADPAIGRQIGGYELTQLLGRGGMGTVYLARRREFEQEVAIKLIRRGFDLDPVVVRRFHNERQILARLEHPYIARLLDGGTAGDHMPYLVMEHVEGEAVDVYCRRLELTVAERLRLFCKVCSAVHFAHRNLVIHRDLKPGNILVTAEGVPKLLDFGIAKLLDDSVAWRPFETATGETPLTPRYASPEQLQRQPVTTASDIYVLGVLLYELLTGLDPYGVKTENGHGEEVTRAVCDLPPQPPSTAVRRRAGERPESLDESRRLRKRLKGDLDSIVLKALRKDPGARYGSVESLAADIGRHLDGEPVSAREGTWPYRAGKFLRRHWVPIAVSVAFLAMFSVAAIQALEHRRERLENRRAEDARLEFFDQVFDPVRPAGVKKEEIRVPDLLERAGQILLEDTLPDDLRIKWAGRLGVLYRDLGNSTKAKELLVPTVESSRSMLGEDAETANHINNLGSVFFDLERYQEAEEAFRESIEMRRSLGTSETLLFRPMSNLAVILKQKGDFAEARSILFEVLEGRRAQVKHDSTNSKNIATALHNLASVDLAAGELEAAEKNAREAVKLRLEAYGDPQSLKVASTQDLLGRILWFSGWEFEARDLLTAALETRKGSYKDSHMKVADSRRNVAETLIEIEPERARDLLEKALVVFRAHHDRSWKVADAESVESVLLAKAGRWAEAEEQARASYERVREIRGAESTPARRAEARWLEISQALEKTAEPPAGRPRVDS